MKKSFCERLRDLRGEDSQAIIAKKLGLSQQSYARYETGVVLPGLEQLHHICCVLKISADWLLGLSDDRSSGSLASPTIPTCPDCQRRDDQIDELFAQLRVTRAELEKKVGNSVSPKHSSASGARKRGA